MFAAMTGADKSEPQSSPRAAALLAWYASHARDLPWRRPPGVAGRPDPYAVWLSEVMLQQTTVEAVKPYFARFLARWPDIGSLAAVPLDDVLTEWAGLGYYARARNLHKCAGALVADHGGVFPGSEQDLLSLPGIGPYTAAAVAAIAFDVATTPVDGNVERVMARLFGVSDPLPGAKKRLKKLAEGLTATLAPGASPGDYAQGVMDLGATVCTPRGPKCLVCPWADPCVARASGIAERLPARRPKPQRPTRRGIAYWTARGDGAVLLRRRAE
ncbi:MAG: A/G-specific adenine glycosylase, partial [Alphaproteobacteria bacterium]|nr:A/G-specific adenine glycosylase [Alphaproteobacteria bacterium]